MQEYQKSEYLVLSDRLYFCRHRQKVLGQELDEKEFKHRCMPQKKSYYFMELNIILPRLIGNSAIALVSIIVVLVSIVILLANGRIGNLALAIPLIVFGPLAILKGFRSYGLWITTLELISKMNGLKEEEEKLRFRIHYIKDEIEQLSYESRTLEEEIQKLEESADNRAQNGTESINYT